MKYHLENSKLIKGQEGKKIRSTNETGNGKKGHNPRYRCDLKRININDANKFENIKLTNLQKNKRFWICDTFPSF